MNFYTNILQLNNIRSHAGAEVTLYATRETMDLPVQGVAQFLKCVLKIDMQDLLCKMEGFAVQGI